MALTSGGAVLCQHRPIILGTDNRYVYAQDLAPYQPHTIHMYYESPGFNPASAAGPHQRISPRIVKKKQRSRGVAKSRYNMAVLMIAVESSNTLCFAVDGDFCTSRTPPVSEMA